MILAALFASCAPAVSPADERDLTRAFELAPGLEVRLWADTPQLYNPTAIDVDARGRIWVAEAVDYRQWSGRNAGLHRDAGDRIVILEDTDGDGVCDSSKVFVQEQALLAPLGICVLGQQVIVSCSPDAIVYTDENGDDVPDKREVLLGGFGGRDHDHGLHSFVCGPDGECYGAVGNAGPHRVSDKRGWTLRSGSIYRDGGPEPVDNKPGLQSDDGRVYTGGLILRVSPRGERLRVLAHNFRNEYEVALDSFGNLFTRDNDDDGSQACRTLWVMEGGNYGYFSADGSRTWSADRRPGQETVRAHWHQDDPGVAPTSCVDGAGGPTGLCVYEGGLLPREDEGLVLGCDAGRNLIFAHRPVREGSGLRLEHGVFLAAREDPRDEHARWFRPSDLVVGAEGALYVADWWDPGVGGHQAGDREARGRILRIAPRGDRTRAPRLELSSAEGAAAALRSPAANVRAQAARALAARGDAAMPALEPLLASGDARLVARALWVLGAAGDGARRKLAGYLADPDPRLRATAVRSWRRAFERLRFDESRAPERLFGEGAPLTETDPEVLRELAQCMAWNLDGTGRWRAFTGLDPRLLLDRWDGRDPWLLESLCAAYSEQPELVYTQRKPEERDPLRWSERFARLAWRVHPAALVPDFLARALSAALPLSARREALESLGFVREREAAEAMLTLALGGPADLRELARWWIGARSGDAWSAFGLEAQLERADLEPAQLAWSSGTLVREARELDVALAGAARLELVVEPGAGGNGCDWSDWIEPRLVGASGETPLAKLLWRSAEAGWGEVRVDQNCEGGALALADGRAAHGIGTHARSRIVYDLPAGAERLRATVGLDHAGLAQACSDGVEFQVWLARPHDRSRERALAERLELAQAGDAELADAARELCGTRAGALELVRLASARRLSERVLALCAPSALACAELDVRALAEQYFPREAPGATPASFQVLRLPGDARDGARIFFGERAHCSTCHAYYGRGGDIGPDLTTLSAKFARKEILESILHPSAAIAFGYELWLFETQDGVLVPGFLVSDGEQVVIKDSSGQRRVFAAGEIASRTRQKASVMPEDVAAALAPQELADLVEFLATNPRVPGRRQAELQLFDGQSLAGWRFVSSEPGAKVEDVFRAEAGVLACTGRPIGYLVTERSFESFELELEWRFDPARGPGNSGVLLRVHGPDKVWPASIEAQLEHRNAGDIWNIDSFPMQVDAGRTAGRRTEKQAPSNEKPLGEWNAYRIVLDGGELALYVNGELQNRAHWCEELPGGIALQSEGAAIQFRNVRLTPIER